MSVHEAILQGVRDLFVTVAGVSDGKVIVAGAKGPRPAKPYWTLRVTSARAGDLGPAERVDGLTGGSAPQATMREQREATLSLQGFGTGAAEPLDRFALLMDSPASLTAQETLGLTLMVEGGPNDISQIVDTAEEPRTLLELRARFRQQSDAQALTELTSAEVSVDIIAYDGDPDPLPIDAIYSW